MSDPLTSTRQVLVIGSLNADLITRAPRLPRPGETVIGGSFQVAPGGKGANQAVAAARMGAPVAMIGRVGADAFGQLLREELAAAGVRVEHLGIDPDAATGTAQIVVDPAGRNAIVVASGANARLDAADLARADALWESASVLVLQLEVPLATIAAAIAIAAARRVPVLLNAAPAQPLPAPLVRAVSWLVVNEVEAEQLTGCAVASIDDAFRAAAALRQPGQRVVITLGAGGAVLVSDDDRLHLPAPRVAVVDTTAAGDAFVGALAAALHHGIAGAQAIRAAVAAGSLACTKLGAIPSLPSAAEVEHLLAAADPHAGSG